jgi:hypothetical protein
MSASGAPLPGQPLPLRILLDHAVGVSRRNFRAIYPTVAIPLALSSGCYPIIQGVLMGPLMTERTPDMARFAPLVAALVVGAVVVLAVYLLANGAMYVGAMDAAADRPVSMGRAWRMVARPPIWGTMILSGIAFVAGFMCCILPGLYVGLLFSLVMAVMVEEGLTGTAALRRSAELITYNPRKDVASDPRGKAFLIVFVGMLMSYALAFVLQVPFVIAQQVYMMRSAAGGAQVDPAAMMLAMTWFQVPANVLGAFAQTAVQLYIAVGLALLYLDIRGRKEGLDLEAAVARLEGAPGHGEGPPA